MQESVASKTILNRQAGTTLGSRRVLKERRVTQTYRRGAPTRRTGRWWRVLYVETVSGHKVTGSGPCQGCLMIPAIFLHLPLATATCVRDPNLDRIRDPPLAYSLLNYLNHHHPTLTTAQAGLLTTTGPRERELLPPSAHSLIAHPARSYRQIALLLFCYIRYTTDAQRPWCSESATALLADAVTGNLSH